MYEEVDERYHEKRMLFMRGHNEDLEAEFRRQLLMALGVNGSPLHPAAQRPCCAFSRVSSRGAVQKAAAGAPSPRHLDVSSSASYSEPMTPASMGWTSPPTSSASDYYAQSYTPAGYAAVTSHPALPGYMSTTPDMSNGLYQTSSILAWSQSVPSPQMIHHALPSGLEHPSRQRLASAPDVLMVQAHHDANNTIVPATANRAKSEPTRADEMVATTLPPTTPADWESPPPMTAGSSSTGPGGEDGGSSAYQSTTGSFSSASGEWLPEANTTASTMMCCAPGQDPDLDEFTRYARGLGGQSWMSSLWDTSALGV